MGIKNCSWETFSNLCDFFLIITQLGGRRNGRGSEYKSIFSLKDLHFKSQMRLWLRYNWTNLACIFLKPSLAFIKSYTCCENKNNFHHFWTRRDKNNFSLGLRHNAITRFCGSFEWTIFFMPFRLSGQIFNLCNDCQRNKISFCLKNSLC